MSNEVVFGEVDWNQANVGGGGKSDFLKIEEDSKVQLRVVGNPTQYACHWIDTADGSKRKINSPIGDPKLVQKLENAGFKKQTRWIVKVLDRSDSCIKLLEIGAQVFKGIKELVQDEDWGPVTGYDIKIIRGKKGTNPLYKVNPGKKEPLDSTVKVAIMEFNDRVDVSKFTQPADPDEVRKMMGWKAEAKAPAASHDDDDNMFEFES